MMTCVLSLFVCQLAFNGPPAASQPAVEPDLAGVNPAWLQPMRKKVEQQVTTLKAAYELDAAQEAELRAELHRRLVEQVAVEREYQRQKQQYITNTGGKAGAGTVDPSVRREFMVKMKAQLDEMPLNDERVAQWLESRLPAERVAQGRPRLEELWGRQGKETGVFQRDVNRTSGAKMALLEARAKETAGISPSGKPMPQGDKAEPAVEKAREEAQKAVVQPGEPEKPPAPEQPPGAPQPEQPAGAAGQPPAAEQPPAVAEQPPGAPEEPPAAAEQPPADTEKPPADTAKPATPPGKPPEEKAGTPKIDASQPPVARPAVQKPIEQKPGEVKPPATEKPRPEAAEPPKAPPLDDWDKHVIATSEKYHFTDAQVTKAKAILRDLRQRAYQYRMSRNADFTHAEQLADAKARAERLAQLNKPLNALFDELKQRLEALPTTEQRQQAGTSAPKPKAGPPPPAKAPAPAAPAKPQPPTKPKK